MTTRKNLIEMRITIPREISPIKEENIRFSPDDFSLSWIEFLRKHKRRVFEFLNKNKDKYVVQDIRRENDRKSWRMSDTIKDYINSFKKTMQVYRSVIAKRTDKTVISAPVIHPQAGTSRPAPVPLKTKPNATGSSSAVNNSRASANVGRSEPIASASTSPFKRPAPPSRGENSSKNKQARVLGGGVNIRRSNGGVANAPRVAPPPPPFSLFNYDLDDVISMANSVDSQDSQMEDLIRQGVKVEEIKPKVVKNIVKHVDNTAMLRIRKELQDIIDSGRWLKLTSRLPVTAAALHLIFGLAPTNGR